MSTAQTTAPPPPRTPTGVTAWSSRRATRLARVLEWINRTFLVLIIGLLVLIFWRIEPEWLNGQTVQFILAQNAALEIIAVGMTFAMISANIDLSAGSMLSLGGMVMALVAMQSGNLWLGLLVGLVLIVGVGALTGLIVGRLGISAIVVTLATLIWAAGLATTIHGAEAIPVTGGVITLLNDSVDGWSVTIALVVLCYLAGHLLLKRTKLGRYARAVGGDTEFARRAGVPVARYVIYVFMFMGLMIWLGTIVSMAQLESAQPLAGQGIELEAIVAVVIGGTRLSGGEGSVMRTALGVAFLAVLNDGLSNLGLSEAYYDLWEGVAVITVLAIGVLLQAAVRRARASADLQDAVDSDTPRRLEIA